MSKKPPLKGVRVLINYHIDTYMSCDVGGLLCSSSSSSLLCFSLPPRTLGGLFVSQHNLEPSQGYFAARSLLLSITHLPYTCLLLSYTHVTGNKAAVLSLCQPGILHAGKFLSVLVKLAFQPCCGAKRWKHVPEFHSTVICHVQARHVIYALHATHSFHLEVKYLTAELYFSFPSKDKEGRITLQARYKRSMLGLEG